MRKIREVLRLAFGVGLALRKIERSMGISHATVSSYVTRARAAALSWPLPESPDDTALDRLLFPKPALSVDARPMPDWAYVHLELRPLRIEGKGAARPTMPRSEDETHQSCI